MSPVSPLWVFAYGSLLWHPEFEPAEEVGATLEGYHRSFCMLSIHHRGTPEKPGLVLALDRAEGARCAGLALRVAEVDTDRVLAALRERELVSSAYVEEVVPLDLADGRRVEALAYVVDRSHPQYCLFDLAEQARRIAGAVGGRGPNPDYLARTVDRLHALGIPDPDLDRLHAEVTRLLA